MLGYHYKKIHIALYIRQFIAGFQSGLQQPLLAYYLSTLTTSLNEAMIYISLCVMSSNFSSLVSTLVIGLIYDKKRWTAKLMYLFFVIVKIMAFFLYIVAVSPWMVVVSKLLSGSSFCLQIIFVSEISRLEGKHERISVASKGQSLNNIGIIIGVMISLTLSFFEVNFEICIFKFNAGTLTLYICLVSSVIEYIIYCIVISKNGFIPIQKTEKRSYDVTSKNTSSIFSDVKIVLGNKSFLGYYTNLFIRAFITSTINLFAQAIMLNCFHSKTKVQSINLLLVPSLRVVILSLISFMSTLLPGNIIISFSWTIQAFFFLTIPISWYFLDHMQCYSILASSIVLKALGKALIESVMFPELGCMLPNNLKATGQSISSTVTASGRILAKPLACISLTAVTLSSYSVVFAFIQILTATIWNVIIYRTNIQDKK